MMKDFMGEDFLLSNDTAAELYELYAKDQPIIDYHCHLDPARIARDDMFDNIGQLWLEGDHYKWRVMRQNGIPEDLITGNAPWKDKFLAFAACMPYMIGHPVYHWAHMELKKILHIKKPLSSSTGEAIWDEANDFIRSVRLSPRKLLTDFKVEVVCTTDDPADDLEWHMKNKNFSVSVRPTFRPDMVCTGLLRPDFSGYLNRLENAAGVAIRCFEDLLNALEGRLDFFGEMGCCIADHGMTSLPLLHGYLEDARRAFESVLKGEAITPEQEQKYFDYMLRFFAGEYSKRNWGMQLHLSPLRNVNSLLYDKIGPDCGVDTVGDPVGATILARILDGIEKENGLPKMIFYSLNPVANDVIANMLGSFSRDIPGKMQLGSAWWFSDHLDGIRSQLRLLAATGALGRFIGMLTDSRSFTSYVRFDYFRRILCSEIGERVESGEYPNDPVWLAEIVSGICYKNSKKYFNFRR